MLTRLRAQLALATVASSAALLFLLVQAVQGTWRTWLFFVCSAIAGVLLVSGVASWLRDPRLRWLGAIYVSKLLLLLLLVQYAWVPGLDPGAPDFGFDPQRFYFDAAELAQRGFDLSSLNVSLNYTGVLYYYGVLFALFGHNPFVPVMANALFSLAATLLMIGVAYRLRPHRSHLDWLLGLYLIVPEVLWFDALTARETLATALVVLAVVPGVRLGWWGWRDRFSVPWVLLSMVGIVALAAVRTSMLLPVAISIVVVYVSAPAQRGHRLRVVGLAVPALAILTIGPAIAEALGGYRFGYLEWLKSIRSAEYVEGEVGLGWSEQSIGRLLIPESLFEEVPFGAVRMMVYLAAPLPRLPFSAEGLSRGAWSDWQGMMATTSALIYVALFPLVLASARLALPGGDRPADRVLQVPFWATFAAVGGANLAIIERYRLMMIPFLMGCAWLGATSTERLVLFRLYAAWLAVLVLAGVLFVAYKW